MDGLYLIVLIYHILSTQLSFDGHLYCFHALAIVNSAAVNTGVCVFFQINFFFYFPGYIPWNGIAGSHGSSIFSFLRDLQLCSIVCAPVYFPISSDKDCLSSTSLPMFVICRFFDDSQELNDSLFLLSKGEKERYTHLNAEFQRIPRRDKKEIEENNRIV